MSFLALATILTSAGAADGDLTRELAYRGSDLTVSSFDGYDLVGIRDLPLFGEGDEPVLPVEPVLFELSAGERIGEIEVIRVETEVIPGPFDLPPAQLYLQNRLPEKVEVARAEQPFPSSPVRMGYSGTMGGTRLASILVFPLQWIPESRDLVLVKEIVLRVRVVEVSEEPEIARPVAGTGMAPGPWRSLMLSGDDGYASRAPTFAFENASEFFRLDDRKVEYLIVTGEDMAEEFERLAAWKTARGMPARVVTVSWILSNYTIGVDTQEKIRSFIKDAYESWGTRWVLLGADTGILPTRICRFLSSPYRTYQQGLVPSDLYYACLDGTWNDDGDDVFGEEIGGHNVVDLYPEVFLGRVPVNTPAEARVFVDKVLLYRKNPALDFQKRALFMTQMITPAPCPGTWHGAAITDSCARWVPSDFEVDRLYQCSDYFEGTEELTLNTAFRAMDEGYAVVCQVGHGDEYKMDCATNYFHRAHADSLSNLDRLSLFVLLNCSTANVDVDCLAEHFVRSENGGAIGYIGNSAYGFPSTGRKYQQHLFKLLYGSGITSLGELITYFRLPQVSLIGSTAHRWTQYSYLLLGDPSVEIWTDTPRTLTVSHSASMALSDSTYQVSVESAGSPAGGVLACLWMEETGAYARGLTDALGHVTLPFFPGASGTANLVVIGDGYLPVEGSVSVAGTGRVRVSGVEVDDSAEGNANGRFEAGESVVLLVSLENNGDSAVADLEANLERTAGDAVTVDLEIGGIADTSKVWVGAGGWQPSAIPFQLNLGEHKILGRPSSTHESQEGVSVWLDGGGWHVLCHSGPGSVQVRGRVTAGGAILTASSVRAEIADTLEIEGDAVRFVCGMDTTDFYDRIDIRMTDSAGVRVVTGFAEFGDLEPGEKTAGEFAVQSDAVVPDEYPAWFVLDVTGDGETWTEWVRADVYGPALEILYGRVDDAGGNGAIDPPEQVTLYPALANWGHGGGEADLLLRALTGASIQDSTVHVSSIPAGSIVEAGEGFTLLAEVSAPVLEVEFVVGSNTVGRDTLVMGSPPAPNNLQAAPGPGQIELTWSWGDTTGDRGYRIQRREPGKGTFEFLDVALESGMYVDTDVGSGDAYEYAVSSFDSSGALSPPSQVIMTWANPSRVEGFPRDATGQPYGSAIAVDIDRDGDLEIVVGTKESIVIALHHDGSLVTGWPQETGGEVWGSPAAGDLDGDGDLEVIASCIDKNIWVWNWDGSLFHPSNNPRLPAEAPGWPRKAASEFRTAPTLADLDGDGRPEILAGGWSTDVYCWRYDGTGYLDTTGFFAETVQRVWGSPATADLDGDDTLEVVVGTLAISGGWGQLFVWNHDGTDFAGSQPFAQTAGSIYGSPAIGNIDADSELEILIGSDLGKLYAWNHDGTGVLDTSGVFADFRRPGDRFLRVRSSPALGDIDGDGLLEVVVGTHWGIGMSDTVYALNHDGTGAMSDGSSVAGVINKTYEDTPTTSSPVIADIDGDGLQEILMGAQDGRVYVWRLDRSLLEGWPAQTRLPVHGSPGVADLDRDGDLEVFVGSYDALVHAWDLPWTAGETEWGFFQQGPWHTGLYGFSPPPDTVAPGLAIGVFQNPVLDRSLDVYVSSTEGLGALPTVKVQLGVADEESLSVAGLSPGVRDLHLYHAAHWAEDSLGGVLDVRVEGSDIAGNSTATVRQFAFQRIIASEGGVIQAPDGSASLTLAPGALAEDRFVLVARGDESAGPDELRFQKGCRADDLARPTYVVGPRGKLLEGEAVLLLRNSGGNGAGSPNLVVCELRAGEWIDVPAAQAPSGWVGGRIERFGVFQLNFKENAQIIAETEITGSFPNPFNPETTIRFTVSRPGRVRLTIHDVRGRRVATVVDQEMPRGIHRVTWNGIADSGRPAASGVYFCHLVALGESSSSKLVLLK